MTALPEGWTRRDPTVICLGLTAYDHIWNVESIPEGAGKWRATDFVSTGGGMAATAAVAVAKLGGRARFWGRAGDDAAGHAMRDELSAAGVDVGGLKLFEGAQSSVSGVIVDAAGERLIVNFRGGGLPVAPDWLPLGDIANAGAVLADPRWPEAVEAVFAAARKLGVPTVLDADVAEASVFERLLPLTDHVIFSEQALAAFAGADRPLEKAASYGSAITAVTRGGEGIDWLEDGKPHHYPAFPVAVVDTTGAGDVFHGAWAMAVAAGADATAAAGFASAAAGLKCTRPTGRRGIPDFNETVRLWRERRT
ncbi:PfkB family carbohydrate kinase [Martelella soudanensis]|uniref:PfkB family carbohydrate kinase n=1 Tax=unclassified Martelella TaxID=2629616 RepID=UPI0015DFE63B|nr:MULTISPECIES: PfkB family carbohydrate kinase [unclassified Martelella]